MYRSPNKSYVLAKPGNFVRVYDSAVFVGMSEKGMAPLMNVLSNNNVIFSYIRLFTVMYLNGKTASSEIEKNLCRPM